MAKAQDPPSPVDAYAAPPPPVPAGESTSSQYTTTPPPVPAGESTPSQYTTTPPYYSPQHGGTQQQYYGQPRETNTMAIIALIASCAGVIIPLAYIAGIVMGFIALGQIKRTGENGHGLALGAVIVGFAVLFIELALVALYIIFIVWIIGIANSASTLGGDFG